MSKGEKMELEEYYDYLIDTNIVSEETLNVITSINGYNKNTLDDVLYCVTGYRDIKSYLYYEDNDTFKEYYSQDDVEEFI